MRRGSASGERGILLLIVVSGAWLALTMPVFSQEAYYWDYARHPALSYHDHPPMVAWLIWAGSAVFGDGAFGLRLGTLCCGSAAALCGLVLLDGFAAGRPARILWMLLFLCVPTIALTRFLANPDAPLVCAWMATMAALWRARSGSLAWWTIAGIAAGCALLSKYTAVFLAVGGLLVLCFDPAMRRQWRRPGPWLGIAVAALVFSPVLIWNLDNGFESFRYQTAGRLHGSTFGPHWFLQFLVGQFFVLNPLVALLLPLSTLWLLRRCRHDLRAVWLLAFGLPLLGTLLLASLWMQVKINWSAPAVLPLLLGMVLWWDEGDFALRHPVLAPRWRRASLAVGVLALVGPLVYLVPQKGNTTWYGWDAIAATAEKWEERLDALDGVEGNVFFFTEGYLDAAQLGRTLELNARDAAGGDVLEPTLAQNVFGLSASQFDHWEPPEGRIGQDAIFVLPHAAARAHCLGLVRSRFDEVVRVDQVKVRSLGIEVLDADIYTCRGYRGPRLSGAPHTG